MSKQKKISPYPNPMKYFTYGEYGKDHLALLFASERALASFRDLVKKLDGEPAPSGPGKGLYISFTGTFKDHHP